MKFAKFGLGLVFAFVVTVAGATVSFGASPAAGSGMAGAALAARPHHHHHHHRHHHRRNY